MRNDLIGSGQNRTHLERKLMIDTRSGNVYAAKRFGRHDFWLICLHSPNGKTEFLEDISVRNLDGLEPLRGHLLFANDSL